MKNELASGLMKIGELAKASETNVSTIKFYVKEGLLQATVKTGPNMAYYHPDCVARVRLIRSLQKEHYYPLNVIKHMLESPASNIMEIELLDAIHKVNHGSIGKAFSLADTMRITRLAKDEVFALIDAGLVEPEASGRRHLFSEPDLQVMLLVRRRMDAGIPFTQSVDAFSVYVRSLKEAAKADVDSFVRSVLLTRDLTTGDAVRMISVSDETLDQFIAIKRSALNRLYGSEHVSALADFAGRLNGWLRALGTEWRRLGYHALADLCEGGDLEDEAPVSAALTFYRRVIARASEGLAKSASVGGRAQAYFSSLDIKTPDPGEALLLYCLRLGWLYLAPPPLDSEESARDALAAFEPEATNYIGARGADVALRLTSALVRIGGKP